jgi:hypothetical protein
VWIRDVVTWMAWLVQCAWTETAKGNASMQAFMEYLASNKGKDDKRKRSASKSRERGASQTAASSPAHTPNTTGMMFDTDALDVMDWDMAPMAEQPIQ